MEKKEALKVISEKLSAGKSKSEVFTELLSQVTIKSDLKQYLAMVPDEKDRIRYKNINMILFGLLVFISITKLLMGALLMSTISMFALPLALLIPCISIYFAIGIWNFRGNMYRPLGLIGIAGILQSLSNLDATAGFTFQQVIFEFIFCIPGILVIILAYYIGFKVFPYYGFFGNLQQDKMRLADVQAKKA